MRIEMLFAITHCRFLDINLKNGTFSASAVSPRDERQGKMIDVLNCALSKLSISVSYDGGLMYDGRITCDISSTDTTQHMLFAFEVDIEEECPIDPSTLTIEEAAEDFEPGAKTTFVGT